MSTYLRERRNKLPRKPFDAAFKAWGRYPLRFGGPENHFLIPNGHPPMPTGQGPEGSYPHDSQRTRLTMPAKADFAADHSQYVRIYYRDKDVEEYLTFFFDTDGSGGSGGYPINISAAVTGADVAAALDAVVNGPGLSTFFALHQVHWDVNAANVTVTIDPEWAMLEHVLPVSAVVTTLSGGNYLAEYGVLRAGPVALFVEVSVE